MVILVIQHIHRITSNTWWLRRFKLLNIMPCKHFEAGIVCLAALMLSIIIMIFCFHLFCYVDELVLNKLQSLIMTDIDFLNLREEFVINIGHIHLLPLGIPLL